MKRPRKAVIIYVLASVLPPYSCGNSIPFEEEIRLARPVGIEIQPQAGLNFLLLYYIQNQEKTFDGYNLYISRTTISEGEIYSVLSPFSRDGGLPTFRHGPGELNLNDPQEALLEFYADGITRFEKDIQYYFRMTAHSRENLISKPSNEVNSIARE